MSGILPFSHQFGLFGFDFSALFMRGMNPELIELLEATDDLAGAFGNFTDKFAALGDQFGPSSVLCQCAPVAPPSLEDSAHPTGSLKADGSVITTPGGYKIEMVGQYNWKITGPDGKTTRIEGDPHVYESDNGKWDFKRSSTFVLGDGTRINVTTVPGGAEGMTVTGSLEIISGNDRVVVSDIDKGKGKIGTVTQDGYQHVNNFGGRDVFVMGKETDDWSFQGKEIIGSENGGESFKTGGELHPLTNQVNRFGGGRSWADSVFNGLMFQWQDIWRSNDLGYNAYCDDGPRWEDDARYDRDQHIETLRDAFRALADMFDALSRFLKLSDQLAARRYRTSVA